MFGRIDRVKPGLQKLSAVLGEAYPCTFVPADDGRPRSVSRGGVSAAGAEE